MVQHKGMLSFCSFIILITSLYDNDLSKFSH